MKMTANFFSRVTVVVCFGLPVGLLTGQSPDLSTMTLDFKDVTATNVNQTVAEMSGNEKEVEFGDFDNDGDIDVLMAVALSDFGQRRNKLYRNDVGILNEVSGSPVIPGFDFHDTSRSAFFRDFDHDGFLDIVIVNDSNSGAATNDSPGKTKYYRNVAGASFVNESERLNNLAGSACNGTAEDFDGNGYCDLYMCNYANSSQDRLSYNNINRSGAGQFAGVTGTNFQNETEYGLHSEAADMNGDGNLDILTANWTSDPSYIYYNNNNDAGSGKGDFRYDDPGAFSLFPAIGGSDERALVPADFNNDGKADFYFANEGGFGAPRSDAIYVNTGNDADNRAIFAPQAISAELDSETMKVTCNDLDGDGRSDVIVMSEFRRPFIFRNTSENGNVSFVEWTPAVFTTLHSGWQANSENLTGDSGVDVFVGATNDDFLFENVGSPQFDADSLVGGVLPAFHDQEPILVVGDGTVTETDVFLSNNVPAGSNVSILLRSFGDVKLEVFGNGELLASSDVVGHGSDESFQFTHTGGELEVRVTVQAISLDGNGDGQVNLLDVTLFVDCITGVSTDCDPFDTNDDGLVTLLDVDVFVDRLIAGSSSEDYFLELLSRSD